MGDLMDDQSLIGDGKTVIEMISDQVPKLITDHFIGHQMCMEKQDLSVIYTVFHEKGPLLAFFIIHSNDDHFTQNL